MVKWLRLHLAMQGVQGVQGSILGQGPKHKAEKQGSGRCYKDLKKMVHVKKKKNTGKKKSMLK